MTRAGAGARSSSGGAPDASAASVLHPEHPHAVGPSVRAGVEAATPVRFARRPVVRSDRGREPVLTIAPGNQDALGIATLAPGSWERPPTRPGVIDRVDLVSSLRDTDDQVVVVTAPAGYGKTTTVQLWDQADPRPFAWVHLDRLDDDPVHLIRHLAAALSTLAPIDPDARRVLDTDGRSPELDLVPIVSNELRRRSPMVLVLDDVHLVTSAASRQCLERLLDSTPHGSTVALVGRTVPTVRIARRRMDGTVHDVDAAMLALSADEARQLFEVMAVPLRADDLRELVAQTEGWPGGLHLAALGIGNRRGEQRTTRFTGRDPLIADYLVEEVLDSLPDDVATFLERSSILERMSAPLLDEVLETDDAASRLRAIEASGNLFLVPLDRERSWYRYHHLFGELLRARLAEHDPRASIALHRRASDIFERGGDLDGAVTHAIGAGDRERAIALALRHAPRLTLGGRVGVLTRWMDQLHAPTVATTPEEALLWAWVGVGSGDIDLVRRKVERALDLGGDALLPDGVTTVAVAAASIRALVAPGGIAGIIEDTATVVEKGTPAMRPWWGLATTLRATALSMAGAVDEAEALLEAARSGVTDLPALASALEAHLALIAVHRGDLPAAEVHMRAARRLREHHNLEGLTAAMVVFGADALVSALLGDRPRALREAAIARELLPRLEPVPRTALLGHVLLARTGLLVDDRAAAARHVVLAELARSREPRATRLDAELDDVRARLEVASRQSLGGPALTPAELRVLPYLATHLSLKEIAADLIISRNTAKSHAVSIYRKLGATSRSEAVARATDLGLLHP